MSICVLGSVNQDILLRVGALPKPGETVQALGVSTHLGGKGANQAVAAARMGGAVALIGATGEDEAAQWMRARLGETGVDITRLAKIDGAPSGQAYVMVSDDGENSIIVVGGANLALTGRHAPDAVFAGHGVVVSQLETPVDLIEAVYSRLDGAGAIRILNAAPALADGARLFPHVDILIINETELAAYADLAGAGPSDDPVERARSLIGRPEQAIVVTLGGTGVAIVQDHGATRIPGHRVKVVDTTGAGDCFCGVLAAELARGASLEAATRFANAAAALAVTRLGAASSSPTREDVAAFLEGSG